MNKFIAWLMMLTGIAVAAAGCSDKNSAGACLHETSLNLDRGNYDAVLASPCADAMTLGAAYIGKAGFDIKDVINQFISANDTSTTQTDLTLYMTALVPGTVNDATLADLDNAKSQYSLIPPTSDTYRDAQFYISLVDAVKSLSLIKIVVPNVVNDDGILNTACDYNANGVPDDADATACELIAAANISEGTALTCSGATYSPPAPVPISQLTYSTGAPVPGNHTYSGLTVALAGTGDTSGCIPAGNSIYKRLLYQDTSGKWFAATTTAEMCTDPVTGNQWPCPVTGPNLDLVATIDISLDSSVNALSTAITSTTSTDVQTAINDIKDQACTTPCGAVCPGVSCPQSCASGAATYCTSQNIANYIETYLK